VKGLASGGRYEQPSKRMLVQTQTMPEIFFSFFQVELDLPAMKKQFPAKNF
jgi:hypothetical protein